MHENSIAAYRTMNLTKSQMEVARKVLQETKAGRASTIDSLFRKYTLMPTSTSARLGELRKMAERGEAFKIDGEEYALICVGRTVNPSGRAADEYKLESFAVIRAAMAAKNIGKQLTFFQ